MENRKEIGLGAITGRLTSVPRRENVRNRSVPWKDNVRNRFYPSSLDDNARDRCTTVPWRDNANDRLS
jgi:hypothetical protein